MTAALNRNIKLLHFYAILDGIREIWAPVFVIFQMKMIGLTLPEVFIGEAVLAATVFLAEIPTGALADLWGRKKTLIASDVAMVITATLFLTASGLPQIIIAQIFFGVGIALKSGTRQAFLFDTLKGLKREKDHQKVIGSVDSVYSVFNVVSTAIAGLIASINLSLPIIIALICYVLGIAIYLLAKEPKFTISEYRPLEHTLRAFKFTFTHPFVRNLILFSVVTCLISGELLFNTLNPYFELRNVPLWSFGLMFSFYGIIKGLVSRYTHKVSKIIGLKGSIGIVWILSILGFIFLSWLDIGIYSAILFPALLRGNHNYGFIVISDAIHQKTDSHHRATVMSVNAFFSGAALIPILPLFALIIAATGLLGSYWAIAGFIALFGGIFLMKILNTKEFKKIT